MGLGSYLTGSGQAKWYEHGTNANIHHLNQGRDVATELLHTGVDEAEYKTGVGRDEARDR